jgi:hypothetical protein
MILNKKLILVNEFPDRAIAHASNKFAARKPAQVG